MRLRRLLATTAAILAATATSLAATATATATAATPGGPIARVAVGGSTVNGTHPITLTMQSWTMLIKIYGINTTINCTSGSANGVVRGGTSGVPTYEMTITSMSLNCPSIYPGTTVTWSVLCDIDIDLNDRAVHTGLTDTGANPADKFHRVAGIMWFTNHATPAADCLQVSISNGCQYKIGNFSDVGFDEAVRPNGSQGLYLTGNGPTIKNPNAACLGSVGNGQTFTVTAVWNVASPDGPIDLQN